MRHTILLLLFGLLGSGLFLGSCQKEPADPCANINCVRGNCVNGRCDCPEGYEGPDCSDQINPCADVNCLNGGICVSGTCNCPSGYGGVDCGTMLTPTAMIITSIKITSYPILDNNNAYWDPNDSGIEANADVFITLNSGTSPNRNQIETENYVSNATGQELLYDNTNNPNTFPIRASSISNELSLAVWDWDFNTPPQLMTGVYFKPINKISATTGFPSSFTVSTNKIRAIFQVEWEF